MIINRLQMPISVARAIEDTNAIAVKTQASLDYIAMMADIDMMDDNEQEEQINVSED